MNQQPIPIELANDGSAIALLREVTDFWGEPEFVETFDGPPNRYKILKHPSLGYTARVTFFRNHRTLEGLVHELLHLKLLADRYPYFRATDSAISVGYMSAMNNSLQHEAMRPIFERMGFDVARFESERPEYNDRDKIYLDRLKNLAPFSPREVYIEKARRFFELDSVSTVCACYFKTDQGIIEVVSG